MWNLWSLPGDGEWENLSPREGVPDMPQATNRVIASNDCDDSCTATLKRTLNTLEPLVISFDRYVDKKVTRDEGLHVEYSVDGGTTWTTLASYTQENDGDTRRWEKTVLGLSIPESSAQFRFHAKSNQDDEYVEVDNLRIFRPSDAAPDATVFGNAQQKSYTHHTAVLTYNIAGLFALQLYVEPRQCDRGGRIRHEYQDPQRYRCSIRYQGVCDVRR